MTYTSPALKDSNSRWLDVDFERAAADAGRSLGYLPMTPDRQRRLFTGIRISNYADWGTIIPESEWDDRIEALDASGAGLNRRLVEVKDQDGEGSCVANATTTAHQIMQALEWGDANVRILSAISVYRECAPGPNTGSNVGDVMRQMIDVGAIVSSSEPKAGVDMAAGRYVCTHPDVGYSKKPAVGWQMGAATYFRVDEWSRLASLKEIISANLCGFPVVGARNRHCICFPRWFIRGGKRVFAYINSWGDWGDQVEISDRTVTGLGYDSESTVASWAGREAWCPRTIIKPSWMKV